MEWFTASGASCRVLQSLPEYLGESPRVILAFVWIEITSVLFGGILLWAALRCLSNLGKVRSTALGTRNFSSKGNTSADSI